MLQMIYVIEMELRETEHRRLLSNMTMSLLVHI